MMSVGCCGEVETRVSKVEMRTPIARKGDATGASRVVSTGLRTESQTRAGLVLRHAGLIGQAVPATGRGSLNPLERRLVRNPVLAVHLRRPGVRGRDRRDELVPKFRGTDLLEGLRRAPFANGCDLSLMSWASSVASVLSTCSTDVVIASRVPLILIANPCQRGSVCGIHDQQHVQSKKNKQVDAIFRVHFCGICCITCADNDYRTVPPYRSTTCDFSAPCRLSRS